MAREGLLVRESVLQFGPRGSLVGVLSDPADRPAGAEHPALVLLNAGILHRVGPNRLHVTLARRAAARGWVAARFDHSGIGDSPAGAGRGDFADRAAAEIRDCMDVLASKRGIRRFILAGLCSGADHALRVASEDARVTGAVLIDVNSMPSAGHLVDSYRAKLLRPQSWLRLLTGQSEAWSTVQQMFASRMQRPARREVGAPVMPTQQDDVAARTARVLDRGGRLLLVFSAGNPAHYNYRALLESGLSTHVASRRARVEIVDGADHAFTPLEAQYRLVASVESWFDEVEGLAPGGEGRGSSEILAASARHS